MSLKLFKRSPFPKPRFRAQDRAPDRHGQGYLSEFIVGAELLTVTHEGVAPESVYPGRQAA
jgi:hypothetical protein